MVEIFQGTQDNALGHFGIVVSRYNESVTSKLLAGALETFQTAGVTEDRLEVVWVPGAWEIPIAAQRLAATRRHAAIICLGAVIRGETTHDQHINRSVSQSLAWLALQFDVPIQFGLLTCQSLEQAIHRSGGSVGNKGVECAQAALEMASLMDTLPPLLQQDEQS